MGCYNHKIVRRAMLHVGAVHVGDFVPEDTRHAFGTVARAILDQTGSLLSHSS